MVHLGGSGGGAPLELVTRISVPADPGASADGGLAGVTGDAIAPLADTVRFGVGALVFADGGGRVCEAGTKSSSSESDESESDESDGGGLRAETCAFGLRIFCGTVGGMYD